MKTPKALSTVRIPSATYSPALAEQRQQERAQARLVGGPVFVRDDREKRGHGWTFDRCQVKRLETGDYSVLGMENICAVERKSKADGYQTLRGVRSRRRFAAELERGQSMKFFAVVFECSISDFREPPPIHGNMKRPYNKDETWHHLERLWVRYGFTPCWCDGRVQAKAVAERLLRCAYLEHWRDIC